MFYIIKFLENDLKSEKVAKKRAQNHDFFILSFLKFYNFFKFFKIQFLCNSKENFIFLKDSKGNLIFLYNSKEKI